MLNCMHARGRPGINLVPCLVVNNRTVNGVRVGEQSAREISHETENALKTKLLPCSALLILLLPEQRATLSLFCFDYLIDSVERQ